MIAPRLDSSLVIDLLLATRPVSRKGRVFTLFDAWS
jgi:hypothetical protein